MFQGLYGAAITMNSAATQHEMIAKNLAHAQMPGFRRSQVVQGTFENSLNETSEEFVNRSSAGVRGAELVTDFSDGSVQATGRMFDVAIQGEGFFVLAADDQPLYTRNGSFAVDESGKLVTRDGREVQGKSGPIQIDTTNGLSNVSIDSTGRVTLNETELGQIKIVRFEEPTELVNVGTTLFQAPENKAIVVDDAIVASGHLEGSNVHPVLELVDMIAVQRRYDAAARSMKLLMRTLEQHINLQRGS